MASAQTATATPDDHRHAISKAIGPDLPLRFLQSRDGFAMYVGLFGTWSLNGQVNTAKVVIATVRLPTVAPAPPTVSLGECPWFFV